MIKTGFSAFVEDKDNTCKIKMSQDGNIIS